MQRGNALIGQSGGPTTVINSSLAGVIDAAQRSKRIDRILGMRFAIEGVLNGRLIDLSGLDKVALKKLQHTPSSALGSSRLKLKDEHFAPILQTLKKFDIRFFFMIGGNDTMDTIHRVVEYAQQKGYELTGVGIPKTVDNDLYGTDHTPGFPSAARYVATSVQQAGLLARDMQRVDQFVVFQTVGRSAGWLAGAAACARREAGDPPQIILMPEVPFDRDAFLQAVAKTHKKQGYVSIVCGEGIAYADGTPVSASQVRDKFNNVEFGAMGGTSAALVLHRMIANEFGWRGEFQIPESLQMCAADRAVKLDIDEAFGCGQRAVKLAESGISGVMVTIKRTSPPDDIYLSDFGTIPLKEVAIHARPMPPKYITRDGMNVTKAFLDYVHPLVGEMAMYEKLGGSSARP